MKLHECLPKKCRRTDWGENEYIYSAGRTVMIAQGFTSVPWYPTVEEIQADNWVLVRDRYYTFNEAIPLVLQRKRMCRERSMQYMYLHTNDILLTNWPFTREDLEGKDWYVSDPG